MKPSTSQYELSVENNVSVQMSDSVCLATDIYHPSKAGNVVEGKFPTILGRIPYDKAWEDLWVNSVANYFTPRGYVVVVQDVRGRGKPGGVGNRSSGGEFMDFFYCSGYGFHC